MMRSTTTHCTDSVPLADGGLVIFDWDGTITDVVGGSYAAVEALCRLHGHPLPTFAEMMAGMSEMGSLRYYRTLLPDEPGPLEVERLIVEHRRPKDAPIFPDVTPSLMRLRKWGVKIALVSRAESARLKREVEYAGLHSFFDHICWQTERRKSENIVATIATLLPPSDRRLPVYYIGDELADIAEAELVPGVQPLAVSRGTATLSALSKRAPTFPSIDTAVAYILDAYAQRMTAIDASVLRTPRCEGGITGVGRWEGTPPTSK